VADRLASPSAAIEVRGNAARGDFLAEQHSVFPNQASEFVALTHYCRWREEDGRRETWDEVVERVVSFLHDHTPGHEAVPLRVWERIRDGLATFSVMPSMRLVATAGPVVLKDNACIYNCAYFPIRDLRSFSELMFLLMYSLITRKFVRLLD
jgi:ribonucleoside-diphosphate reductase alpha chain